VLPKYRGGPCRSWHWRYSLQGRLNLRRRVATSPTDKFPRPLGLLAGQIFRLARCSAPLRP
jgi:hypothetical protein